ncbi:hypothetical protein RUM43_002024 [Polyplax serrata]|uniref:Uncharacterized protein n=1 Tax=Polyplax serrata TaxID=468196 RepID=A0AAN8PLU7_POLSC
MARKVDATSRTFQLAVSLLSCLSWRFMENPVLPENEEEHQLVTDQEEFAKFPKEPPTLLLELSIFPVNPRAVRLILKL